VVPPWEGGDIFTSTLEKWGKYDLLEHINKYWKSQVQPGKSIFNAPCFGLWEAEAD
jgi:hypothetical protein